MITDIIYLLYKKIEILEQIRPISCEYHMDKSFI